MVRSRRLPGPSSSSSSSSRHHRHDKDNTSSLYKTFNFYWNKWAKWFGVKNPSPSGHHRNLRNFVHQQMTDKPDEEEDDYSSSSPTSKTSGGIYSNMTPVSSWTAFKFLISARICSALWSIISDCDETFNYWEPFHFLLEGWGLETWEYSPVYAIRSYAYLWMHTPLALLFKCFFGQGVGKILLFYYTRFFLAAICAASETYLLNGVNKKFGSFTGRILLALQVLSIGMMISSTAFLPSSFSMYMTFLILGSWMQNHVRLFILSSILSIVVGWPFSGVISIPIGLHILLEPLLSNTSHNHAVVKRRMMASIRYLLRWTILIAVSVLVPLIVIDSLHYGKLTFASFNIVMYNVLSKEKGPELYGTEPWSFYPYNLFLNFNLMFSVSIALLPVFLMAKLITFLTVSQNREGGKNLVASPSSAYIVLISVLCIWFLIFVPQAHKEERFMFPIYPLITLTAALSLDLVTQLTAMISSSSFMSFLSRKINFNVICFYLTLALVLVSGLLSVSRGITLYQGYHAPLDVYKRLEGIHENIVQLQQNKTSLVKDFNFSVCVGKEWHRFPSSFFLPDNRWRLKFVKSHFSGQLPKPFEESIKGVFNRTRVIPTAMNDMNREEMSRYVSVDSCHFIVDSDYPDFAPEDVPYSRNRERYQVVYSHSFLDSSRTEFPWRSFFVPFYTFKKWSMINYNLLRDVNNTLDFPSHVFDVL